MKTRRILAASTAALLAFGTTAAYVASAATTTYSAASLAYPVDYAGTQDKAIGELATATVSGSDVTIKFATKTRADIAAMPMDSADVSPLYLTVTTNIASNVGAGDGGFTFTSGSDYTFDNAEHKEWNFAEGKIKLWLPATTTGDKLTIKYKVGTGAEETLTINYKYKTPPTPMDKAVLDTEGDWEDFDAVNGGISANIAYKMSEAALEKNDGWILKVTNKNSSLTTYTAIREKDSGIFKGISSTTAKSIIKEYDEEGKLAVLDFSVGEPDDEDWVDVGSTKLPAAISLRVSNLGFKPKHVYHFTNGQLVELDARQIKITEDESTSYGIEFTTKSFSPYVFSENAIKGAVAADDKDNPETSGNTSNAASTASKPGSTTNPDTGIALAIAPVVLAAGAVAVVALKKKH